MKTPVAVNSIPLISPRIEFSPEELRGSAAAAKITIGNVTIEITRPGGRRLPKGNFVHSLVIAHTADKLQGDCPGHDVAKSLVTAPCNFPIQSCVTELATLRGELILLLRIVPATKLYGEISRTHTLTQVRLREHRIFRDFRKRL